MENSGSLASAERRCVNTLAQVGTDRGKKKFGREPVSLNGLGTDLSDSKLIQRRAKRKHISQIIAKILADIAIEDGNKALAKTFWNTYYCLDKLYVSNGRLYGKFCKNRICTVCLCIRKAETIRKYLPIIQQWEDPHFVTLTIKAVSAGKLKALIENMKKGLKKILAKYKKAFQRGGGIEMVGIYSIECNFNPVKRTYNPHLHFIVANEQIGKTLIKEWLSRPKKGWTVAAAQDIQRIDNPEVCLIEVVKYGSKILTENDLDKKANQSMNVHVYAKALYTIIKAMKGRRIFDKFGFNLPKETKLKVSKRVSEYEEFDYNSQDMDWMDSKTRKPLTKYLPEPNIKFILGNRIDTSLY